jgi:hypothetical protein
VVVATDENPMFYEFVPLVVGAWKKFFPNVKVTVAVVSKYELACECDDLVYFEPIPEIPTGNHAKVARYFAAGRYPDEVCMVHDMDSVPLQRDYYERIIGQREPGRLLCVGAEVYRGTPHSGKFPAAMMTGEGRLFRWLFGDNVRAFIGLRMFDEKEDIANAPEQFSDESLVRALLATFETPVQHVDRGADIYNDWIDRSWWRVDVDKLNRGGYYECNLLRPWHAYVEQIQPVVDYIFGGRASEHIRGIP